MKKSRKKQFLFSGKVIDLESGREVHKAKCNSPDEFDELFTKPMRRKLR